MIFFRRSMATDNRARATMTCANLRILSEALMNAATSQADKHTRVSCTVNCSHGASANGGVAINCSQIFFLEALDVRGARWRPSLERRKLRPSRR